MEISVKVILHDDECQSIEQHLLPIATSQEWFDLYGSDAAKALVRVCDDYCGPDKLEAAKDAAAAIYEWAKTNAPTANLEDIDFLAWFLDDAYRQATNAFMCIVDWAQNNPEYKIAG